MLEAGKPASRHPETLLPIFGRTDGIWSYKRIFSNVWMVPFIGSLTPPTIKKRIIIDGMV